jgi:hypothetical protein
MGIEIAKELPISIIAKACDTTFKVIREMNPEIRLESIPPGRFSLNVPRGRAGKCSANLLHLLSQKVTEASK